MKMKMINRSHGYNINKTFQNDIRCEEGTIISQ